MFFSLCLSLVTRNKLFPGLLVLGVGSTWSQIWVKTRDECLPASVEQTLERSPPRGLKTILKESSADPDLGALVVGFHSLKVYSETRKHVLQLTSCGVYQRGKEGEGVFGFLVDDIRQEIRRSARLTCCSCKKKGACVSAVTSYCPDHSPTQSLFVGLDLSLPQSCSVCLDSIDPVLSYSVLKCPSCHTSWFHRDCVQVDVRPTVQASSSSDVLSATTRRVSGGDAEDENLHPRGVVTVTNTEHQERMREMRWRLFSVILWHFCGDLPPWELEAKHTPELLESLLAGCGALTCLCSGPHTLSKDRCDLGSPVVALPMRSEEVTLSKSIPVPIHSSSAVKRFKDKKQTPFLSSLRDIDAARQYFWKLLVQQIQDSVVFEGPEGSKNLALDSQALRDDLYFDVGCLLALSLVHGGPPVGFFSHALYQCLFNYPSNRPLTVAHMTPDTHFTRRVSRIAEAESLDDLRAAVTSSWEYLELAGCSRPISSLEEREALVEDLVSFTMITRMQLPLQRCSSSRRCSAVFSVRLVDRLTAQTLDQLFTVNFSEEEEEERLNRETPVISFWRHFLLECEVGGSISLPRTSFSYAGLRLRQAPPPSSLHLLPHPAAPPSRSGGVGREEVERTGLFPQRSPAQTPPPARHLLLPRPSKAHMEPGHQPPRASSPHRELGGGGGGGRSGKNLQKVNTGQRDVFMSKSKDILFIICGDFCLMESLINCDQFSSSAVSKGFQTVSALTEGIEAGEGDKKKEWETVAMITKIV
ncbi:G2/M phase-specific E3 ubiquitin-protein ligase [Lates japonicus]|uniref:G2/M phase-specific E3 ubiquitin-protein ligase n=1 Tax=Lates japonicus TaxID=270547 RepID=A0AAD3NG82_LATJO|nr:G2/M phase-specific E3 ubiquitin-protein ligase [Lates japonicus]